MSWEATAYVNNIRAGISRSEKLLLLVLANYHNKDKHAAWPSLKSLSEDGLISVRQASRLVHKLQTKGVLTITPEGARGLNIYRFVGLDVQPTIDAIVSIVTPATIDKMSIVPDVPTIDISSTTIDISDPTIDIAMSSNPTREPTKEPTRKRGAKRAAPTDPRSQHPAIQALQRLAHTCPDRGVWDQLIVLLGDSPDVALLGRCYSEWVGRGFKKTNWLGVVEWYCQGIPSTARGNGQAKRSADVGASPVAPSKNCGKPARFTFTWPGSAPSICCEECLALVTGYAEALGLTVRTSPLEGEAQPCP